MTEQHTHTPGPWRAFIKNGVIAVVAGAKRSHKGPKEVVKWTGFEGSDFPQHAIANSFLIAAAPDMLATLRHVSYFLNLMSYTLECQETAEILKKDCEAAIAKAEGVAEGASAQGMEHG